MRFFRSERVTRSAHRLSAGTIGAVMILSLFVVGMLPAGYARTQSRAGWVISCPSQRDAQWLGYNLEYPNNSVAINGGRVVRLLVSLTNGGRYFFKVMRTSPGGSSFQVHVSELVRGQEVRQHDPNRPEPWREIFPYKRSKTEFGGKAELSLPGYACRASDASVSAVFLLFTIYPDDQVSQSTYKLWYAADQCFQPSPAQPGGCRWEEVTLLGQPQGWNCVCDGRPADPARCGPRPR